jgi:hypothetical protein
VTVELDDFGVQTGTSGFARGRGARDKRDRHKRTQQSKDRSQA